MPVQHVVIETRSEGRDYIASYNGHEGEGGSPDEAVGHLLRELWLSDDPMFHELCRFELRYNHK